MLLFAMEYKIIKEAPVEPSRLRPVTEHEIKVIVEKLKEASNPQKPYTDMIVYGPMSRGNFLSQKTFQYNKG